MYLVQFFLIAHFLTKFFLYVCKLHFKRVFFIFGKFHQISNLGKSSKLGWPFFSHFINWRPLSLKAWHFEASEAEDVMTKFKSQAFHIIRNKYWNAGGSGNPSSLIPALWNIDIFLHKQATHTKHFEHSMARANLNKSEVFFDKCYRSIKVRT